MSKTPHLDEIVRYNICLSIERILSSVDMFKLRRFLEYKEKQWEEKHSKIALGLNAEEYRQYSDRYLRDLLVPLKKQVGISLWSLGRIYATYNKMERQYFRSCFLTYFRIFLFGIWQEKAVASYLVSPINKQFIYACRSYFFSGSIENGFEVPKEERAELFVLGWVS